jgi:polysaccharide deacetylase family protein (PEP-CTERM system associated)
MGIDLVPALRAQDFANLPRRLSFTVDVEDHRQARHEASYPLLTRRLLDFLEARSGRGTFFLLDEAARRTPELVREIAGRGHEVASHGETHDTLERLTPRRLAAGLARSRERLRALSGQEVVGFRAPRFSLTAATTWAAPLIADAGFRYSASVLPGRSFSYGYPEAPRQPFRWPCGLLEIPCPVARLGPMRLAYLGGMYLRYLPPWRLRAMARRDGADALWTYCHPYDIDAAEGLRLTRFGLVASFFLSANRSPTMWRLAVVMEGRVSIPLCERLDELGTTDLVFPRARQSGGQGMGPCG